MNTRPKPERQTIEVRSFKWPRRPHGECLRDVDIVLPVQWMDTVLKEVDLELDILHWADGRVHVCDQSV